MLLPTSKNVKTVTDLREDTLGVLRDVQKFGLVYLFQHSDPKAVVISMDEFARLQEAYEDYIDNKDAVELEKEDLKDAIEFKTIAGKYLKGV
ncbi:MAG: type II toxin-antitoxin system prevent-host-death family antitoxin [bacterium]|nr:type II toxin-antitoxin system prevent-host-death family antitoxin [bacterium]